MTKNVKTVILFAIAAVIVLVGLWLMRDLILKTSKEITCEDGPRRTIDIRDFTRQYWAYSVQFEASVDEKTKFIGKLTPSQLQQVSESFQQAIEFRKFLVAGFNACAISKTQYAQYGVKFQALDALSRQIDSLAGQSTLSDSDRTPLSELVQRFIAATQELGTGGSR